MYICQKTNRTISKHAYYRFCDRVKKMDARDAYDIMMRVLDRPYMEYDLMTKEHGIRKMIKGYYCGKAFWLISDPERKAIYTVLPDQKIHHKFNVDKELRQAYE